MTITVLTLFPEMIRAALGHSVIGRALERGCFVVEIDDIRTYAQNAYGRVDDTLFGGGRGMLLMAEPLTLATEAAVARHRDETRSICLMSPRGATLTQDVVESLATREHLVLVCGHYEGVDQRYIDHTGAMEVSIGDYVLTGGELGALVVLDAVVRRLPGVLPDASVVADESFATGLLAEPQYTRPAIWRGHVVPAILRSGHEARIQAWKHAQAVAATLCRRPDLAGLKALSEDDWIRAMTALAETSSADDAGD